jgi:outer membrane protein
VTLAAAIQMAQKNSPQTINARGTEVANQAAVRAAYGAFLPSLSANVGAGRQFTGVNTTTRVNQNGERVTIQGNTWTYSNSFSLNAQLFSADRIPSLHAAKANVEAAQQNSIVQSYSVALSVEQQFYAALSALESEDAARTQLEQALQQLDASRKRVIAGAATASDSLRATTLVLNARLALLTAQNSRRNANAILTRLTGSTIPLSAALNDPVIMALDTVALDSASVVSRAESSPSVDAASANRAAAAAERSVAKASYLPTVNASYSRGGSGLGTFGFGNNPSVYSGQLNLGVSLPIFQQFSRQAQVARATVAEENATASLRDTRLQARQLAIQYLGALRLGQEQVAVQSAAIVAAEEDLRVQRQRYDLGLSTIVDVLTAQTTLNQAQASLIAAHNSVRLAVAQIESLIGEPLTTVTARPTGAPR